MSILFVISILAFCALLWAFFSMARYLRRNESGSSNATSTGRSVRPSSTEILTSRGSR